MRRWESIGSRGRALETVAPAAPPEVATPPSRARTDLQQGQIHSELGRIERVVRSRLPRRNPHSGQRRIGPTNSAGSRRFPRPERSILGATVWRVMEERRQAFGREAGLEEHSVLPGLEDAPAAQCPSACPWAGPGHFAVRQSKSRARWGAWEYRHPTERHRRWRPVSAAGSRADDRRARVAGRGRGHRSPARRGRRWRVECARKGRWRRIPENGRRHGSSL